MTPSKPQDAEPEFRPWSPKQLEALRDGGWRVLSSWHHDDGTTTYYVDGQVVDGDNAP